MYENEHLNFSDQEVEAIITYKYGTDENRRNQRSKDIMSSQINFGSILGSSKSPPYTIITF